MSGRMTKAQKRRNHITQYQAHNRSVAFDIIMLICTLGLWGIWMIIRHFLRRR